MQTKNTVKVLVPAMVRVKDTVTKQAVELLAQTIDKRVKLGVLTPQDADRIILSIDLAPVERDFPIEELVEYALNTGPQFSGGTKSASLAFRISAAFAGAKPSMIVELETSAWEKLKAYFEKPEYVTRNEQTGKKETHEGFPFTQYLARVSYPYQDAICNPLTDEQIAALPEPPEPKTLPALSKPRGKRAAA